MKNKDIRTPESTTDLEEFTGADTQETQVDRRKAVQNILAGSAITAAAASSGSWSKPLINAVATPAHAQTSATMVTLAGNVNVSPVTNLDRKQNNSLLDFFIGPAHANAASNLAGSCMTMDVSDTAFTLDVEFASDPMVSITGSVTNGALSGSGSGINVTGTVDLASANPTANGNISNNSGNFGFMLDTNSTACTPIGNTTTTAAPTTTMAPTTTVAGTTMAPTTTMAATTTMAPTTTTTMAPTTTTTMAPTTTTTMAPTTTMPPTTTPILIT